MTCSLFFWPHSMWLWSDSQPEAAFVMEMICVQSGYFNRSSVLEAEIQVLGDVICVHWHPYCWHQTEHSLGPTLKVWTGSFCCTVTCSCFATIKHWNNDWRCSWFGCIQPSGSHIFPSLMINIYKCMPHVFECIMYSISHVYTFWAKKKVFMTCAHFVCVCTSMLPLL